MERQANAAVYEIAYAEAVRALSEQHGVIDSLRTRAGLLLSSAAVTTSFLAGQGIHDGRLGVFAWLGLVDFAAVAVLAIAILQPRQAEFSAQIDETVGVRLGADGDLSATLLYEALTVRLQTVLARNRKVHEHLTVVFQLAGSLLALEVIAWIAAVASAP